MEKEILVCHRTQQKQGGGSFDRYFCYELDDKGEIVVNPATGKGKGIKALIADEVLKDNSLTVRSFPCIMKVNMEGTMEVVTKTGEKVVIKQCKLTIDRDKNGNPRLDKYGKRHMMCKINKVLGVREAPNKEFDWSDVMDFE